MRLRTKKSGFSLTELIVVMSIIGVLAGIGLPAVKQVIKSFESSDRVKDVVAAAMSNARARALARGKYTGIRFQRNAEGDQYMVFIEHDENVGPGISGNAGFRAVKGRNPIRLPKRGAMVDMRLKTDYVVPLPHTTEISLIPSQSPPALTDADRNFYLTKENVLRDLQTFSVIFSKEGKLVLRTLKVSYATDNGVDVGRDIFDTDGAAMFTHDGNGNPIEGLQIESSRNHFVIIDKNLFNAAPSTGRWTSYLQSLKPFYANPYTGELIH